MTSSMRAPTDEAARSKDRGAEELAVLTHTVDEDGVLATGEPAQTQRSPGARVGDYIVLEQLGAGGMGVVYAAHDPHLDRKIALKVLRSDFDPDTFSQARARMIGEGRALARLSHPNVVTVHDVGQIDDEVYIAMELVDGQTLTRWRKEQTRSIAEILEVFLAIAEGLIAIHDAGLVHRDIKPENVLVDRQGRARVTDFGLARPERAAPPEGVVASDAPVALELTSPGARLGTPAYMASEQLRGEPATARSDQFAFCVALWECLWDERPFGSDTMGALVLAVVNGTIREPTTDARAVPAWLRRILERGLRPDAAERWPSMRALATAIANGDPNRRRRKIAIFGATGAVLVVGALAALGVHAADRNAAREACTQSAAEISTVWNPDVRTKVTASFTTVAPADGPRTADDVSNAIDHHVTRWRDLKESACLAKLDEARPSELAPLQLACLERNRSSLEAMVDVFAEPDAVVVARARRTVEGLGDLSRCEDAAALRSAPPEPADPAIRDEVRTLHNDLARTLVHEHVGRFDEGLALSEASLLRALATEHLPVIALARYRVAVFLEKQGKYEDAVNAWAASFRDATLVGSDQLAADAASALAFGEGYQLARHDAGIRWAELAGVLLERLGATETLSEATRLDVLAVLRESKGDLADSIAIHERAIALRRTLVAPNHHSIGYGLANLAGVLESSGERERARDHLLEAKAIFEASFGPDNPTTAHVLHSLANLQLDLGAYDEAEALLLRVQEIWRATLRPDHPDLGDVENAMGDLRRAQGRLVAAANAYARALEIHEKDAGGPTTAGSATELAQVELALGSFELAEQHLLHAQALLRGTGDAERDRVGRVHHGLGTLALLRGNADAARDRFTRSVADFEIEPNRHAGWLVRARVGLAAIAILEGKPKDAMAAIAELANASELTDAVRAEAWAWHARAAVAANDERIASESMARARRHADAWTPGLRAEIDALLAAK